MQAINDGNHGSSIGTSGARRKKNNSPHESSSGRSPRKMNISDHHNHLDDPQPIRNTVVLDDMSFSPAWTVAQQELNLVTPYLPPTLSSPVDRHRQLRPHTPAEYAMLFELQNGDYDSLEAPITNKTILAMVVNVESHIHHNIWTVELKDETSSMKAWMEPTFVQQQLRQTNTIIRPGVVWKLDRVGMLFDQHEEHLERMLLLRGSAIQKVWTPEQARSSSSSHGGGGDDTPEQQRAFLEWLEKRKSLPLIDMDDENEDGPDCPEEDDADYPESIDTSKNGGVLLPSPRRLAAEDDDDEDRFEPRIYGTVLGQQHVGVPIESGMTSHTWSQPRLPQSQQSIHPTEASAAAAGEPLTGNYRTQESNLIPTQPETGHNTSTTTVLLSTQTSLATRILESQPPMGDTTMLQRFVPSQSHAPTTTPDALSQDKEILHEIPSATLLQSQSSKMNNPESTQGMTTTAWMMTTTTTAAGTSALEWKSWNSMLEDEHEEDDDDDGEDEIPMSNRNGSQPPTVVMTENEDKNNNNTLVVPSCPSTLDRKADDDSDDCGVTETSMFVATPFPSMFQSTGMGAMDLNIFNDDDDDDDEDD